ncbi:MAG: hypothetical protein ABIF10_06575 [Candidatus Woesearchaeota archaeon]
MSRRWLLVIFLLCLAMRLFFALQTPYFSSDGAYYVERQVSHILETGFPIYYDELSYGGRWHVVLPVYYYLLAFFGLFLPIGFVLKIVPNVFASCLVFVVYLVVARLTKNNPLALFTGAVSAILPVFVSRTVNHASVYAFAVPLLFLCLYFFMEVSSKKSALPFLFFFFILAFTHTIAFVFCLGLLLYLLLVKLEGLKNARSELEVTLFCFSFVLWLYSVLFKKLFLSYGVAVVWQNVPREILSNYFREVTISGALNQIGLVPLMAGLYIVYRYLFYYKNREMLLLVGFAFAALALLWLKFIPFGLGLMILGVMLLLLFSQFMKSFFAYVKKTRVPSWAAFAALILLFIVTSLVPTIFYSDREIRMGFEEKDISAMQYLRDHTIKGETVASTLREGNLVAAVAERPNVMDTNFLLAPDVARRLADLERIFTSESEVEVVGLLNKYDVHYIVFSTYAKIRYTRASLSFADDANCFQLIYEDKDYQVYKVKCKLEKLL